MACGLFSLCQMVRGKHGIRFASLEAIFGGPQFGVKMSFGIPKRMLFFGVIGGTNDYKS